MRLDWGRDGLHFHDSPEDTLRQIAGSCNVLERPSCISCFDLLVAVSLCMHQPAEDPCPNGDVLERKRLLRLTPAEARY